MAWLTGWAKRIKVTIDQDDIDAAFTGFPILIHLSASSGHSSRDVSCVFDELGNDANRKKIAVTTSDGVTQCYVEIERWVDADEEARLWVKIPSVASGSDTELYLYYDATHADNDAYVGDTVPVEWTSPTGHIEASWTDEENIYDGNIGTYAVTNTTGGAGLWTTFQELTHAAIECDRIRFWSTWLLTPIYEVDIDVYDGSWHDVYSGPCFIFGEAIWVVFPLDEVRIITKVRIRYRSTTGPWTSWCYEIALGFGPVWDGNFLAVYHMKDGADNAHINDSTGNYSPGTKEGAGVPAEVDAKIGKGQDFDGAGDQISLGAGIATRTNFTISSWVKLDALRNYATVIARTDVNRTDSAPPWACVVHGDDKLGIAPNGQWKWSNATGIVAGTWYRVVFKLDSATIYFYVNNVAKGSVGAIGFVDDEPYMYLGSFWDPTEVYDWPGLLDEVRISGTPRSVAWEDASYESERDHLLDFGAEQSRVEKTFTADAILLKTIDKTFTADAVLLKSNDKTFDADAVLVDRISKTYSADAILLKTIDKTFTGDSVIVDRLSKTFPVDAVIIDRFTKTFTADAALLKTIDKTFTGDSALVDRLSKTYTADAILLETVDKTFTADATLVDRLSKTFTADATIVDRLSKTFTADAVLVNRIDKAFTADAVLLEAVDKTFVGDAVLVDRLTDTFTADAVLLETMDKTFTADSVIVDRLTDTFTADAVLVDRLTKTFTADSALLETIDETFTADATLVDRETKTFTADAALLEQPTRTFTADAILLETVDKTFTADAVLVDRLTDTFTADAILLKTVDKTFTADSTLVDRLSKTFTVDSIIVNRLSKTFTADALLLETTDKTFTADGVVVNRLIDTFTADAILRAVPTVSTQAATGIGSGDPP